MRLISPRVGSLEDIERRLLFRRAFLGTPVPGFGEQVLQQSDDQQERNSPEQDHPQAADQHAHPSIEYPSVIVGSVHIVLVGVPGQSWPGEETWQVFNFGHVCIEYNGAEPGCLSLI